MQKDSALTHEDKSESFTIMFLFWRQSPAGLPLTTLERSRVSI